MLCGWVKPVLLCVLPFGILGLSAVRLMFVKIILALCMLVGIVVSAKADSVSSVNGLSCSLQMFVGFVAVYNRSSETSAVATIFFPTCVTLVSLFR